MNNPSARRLIGTAGRGHQKIEVLAALRIDDKAMGSGRPERFTFNNDGAVPTAECDQIRQPAAHASFVSQDEPAAGSKSGTL